jgi:phage terminase large subunit-like protein
MSGSFRSSGRFNARLQGALALSPDALRRAEKIAALSADRNGLSAGQAKASAKRVRTTKSAVSSAGPIQRYPSLARALEEHGGTGKELTAEERSELFWAPFDQVIPNRAEIFAPRNLKLSLASFARRGWRVLEPGTPLIWNWHIDAICAHLEAVSAGEIRRLLINVPPGHMKSLLVSVFWPAWNWLHWPSWRALCASSGLGLAVRDSGKCRDLIQSAWYQDVFQPEWKIKTDSNAKASYQNTSYGLRHAVSVGAATTGFRGNALIIDDLVQVLLSGSDAIREEANKWCAKAASSRLADPRHDAIVMIMQRVHHQDPSAWALRNKTNKFEHLMLPSYFEKARKYRTVLADTERWKEFGEDRRTEEGDLLFPELFTQEVLDGQLEEMEELEFAAQHQQRPTPATGNLFKAEYFCQSGEGKKFWPNDILFRPDQLIEAYICWDTGAKKGVKNDYGAGSLHVRARDGYTYVAPLVLKKMDTTDVEREVLITWATWKHRLGNVLQGAPIEEGASNATAVVQNAKRLMAHRREMEKAFALHQARGHDESTFDWKVPVGWSEEDWILVCSAPEFHPMPFTPKPMKKEQRARGILSFCEGRNVRMVSVDDFVAQLWLSHMEAFPLSGPDDAVDSFVTGIERMAGLSDKESLIDGMDMSVFSEE